MDADEILQNIDQVLPFYQPIFSADEHRVAGYELLGRFKKDDEFISIGHFFADETIPEEYRIEVDNYLLEQALQKMMSAGEDFLLFINRDPKLLMYDQGESFLTTIQKYLAPDQLQRIVLELTNTEYTGSIDSLQHLISYYKTYGIKIALSHLGEESHLDRIAQLSPHILKVNLNQLRNSSGDASPIILYSLNILARKIGANLLYEHIEQEYQLQYAWKNGGRYYQGFLLARPTPDFIDKDSLNDTFREQAINYIKYEKKKLEARYVKTSELNESLKQLIDKKKNTEPYVSLLSDLAEKMETMCFRLYICNEDGFQLSPNLMKVEGNWTNQEEYIGRNWSWRPYFLANIVQMKKDQKGMLSGIYSDIETGESIRTFSFPLMDGNYLFIDLSYAYLYENDALL
ncbi:MAG TPA: EAL-associated domain-containing protein [Bacillaceae bacterium]|nr:EAL-associated domain-containing protein [Bacillaceae bacterium]